MKSVPTGGCAGDRQGRGCCWLPRRFIWLCYAFVNQYWNLLYYFWNSIIFSLHENWRKLCYMLWYSFFPSIRTFTLLQIILHTCLLKTIPIILYYIMIFLSLNWHIVETETQIFIIKDAISQNEEISFHSLRILCSSYISEMIISFTSQWCKFTNFHHTNC